MVLQYIKKKLGKETLQRKILFLSYMEGKCTAVRLKDHIVQCLAERGFPEPEELIKKMTFVSDGGSDFVAALRLAECYRIYCFAHFLNICQSNAFTIKVYQLQIYPAEALLQIQKVEMIVRYLVENDVSGNMQLELPKGVKRGPLPSQIPMLKTFLRKFQQVRDMLLLCEN